MLRPPGPAQWHPPATFPPDRKAATMTDEINEMQLTKTDDPELLEESLFEARAILEDVLEEIAQAAYVVGVMRGLLPMSEEGEAEFDEDDLRKSEHPTLQKLALVIDSIYAAMATLPELPEGEDDEDDDEEEEGEEA